MGHGILASAALALLGGVIAGAQPFPLPRPSATMAGLVLVTGSTDDMGPRAAHGTGRAAVLQEAAGSPLVGQAVNLSTSAGTSASTRPAVALGDFNGDGRADLYWQNPDINQRGYWPMNGTSPSGDFVPFAGSPTLFVSSYTTPGEWTIVGVADFSGDGRNDLLWRHHRSGTVGIWVVDASVQQGAFVKLGDMDKAWEMAGTGDFNRDMKPDIVWQHATDGRRCVWLLNDTTHDGSLLEFTRIPPAWTISLVADFNGDSMPDLLWTNTRTGLRGFWLMNGLTPMGPFIVLAGVPVDWRLAQAGDFNGDGKVDLVWSNRVTGERGLWLMDGARQSGAYVPLPTVPIEWRLGSLDHFWIRLTGEMDFSGDGRADILWQNDGAQQRGYWTMNGTHVSGGLNGFRNGPPPYPSLPPEWVISGAADFNLDGFVDLLWRNRSTGVVRISLMRGSTIDPSLNTASSEQVGDYSVLGTMDPSWEVAGTGDFNGDDQPDIIWQHRDDGRRGAWFLDGPVHDGNFTIFAAVPPRWAISLVADFSGDGKPDLLWTDTQGTLRGFWVMNGLTQQGAFVVLANVPVPWVLAQTGDFNGDKNADLVWSNTVTGQRGIWLMQGLVPASLYIQIANVPTDWRLGPIH